MSGAPGGSALKRTSLAAHLEHDNVLSSARRKEKSHSFASQMSTSSLERKLLAAQEAQRSLEARIREQEQQIDRLESDRRFLAEREKEEREEKEAERKGRDEEKTKSETSLRNLRNQLMKLQGQYEDLHDSYSSLQRTSSLAQSTSKTQLQTLQHQVTVLQSDLTKYQQQAKDKEDTVRQLHEELEEMSLSRPTADETSSKDWEVVREELKRQATGMKALESMNAQLRGEVYVLRDRASNAEVLKEQKATLEHRLEGMEKLRKRTAELERELDLARKELATLRSTPSASGSADASRELSNLRSQHIRALNDLGIANSELKLRDTRVSELEGTVADLQTELEGSKKTYNELELRAVNSDRKLAIAERDIGFLKAMVSSFEAERAVSGMENPDESIVHDADRSVLLDERVEVLQSTIEELQIANARMEHALRDERRANGRELLDKERHKMAEVEEELTNLRKSEETYLDKIEGLEQTLWQLRGDIASGELVPPGTRVLQLKDNPATRWEELRKEVLDGLRKENDALIKRLTVLEKQKGSSSKKEALADGSSSEAEAVVPKASWDRLQREKAALDVQLEQRDKRLARLQQVYALKSKEFREAIQEIVGIKLAFYDNGQVRVTSQYDFGCSFVFKPTGPGGGGSSMSKMQLIGQGEGGPEEIPHLMKYWIEEQMCIPGFMASITLECYDRKQRLEREAAQARR